VLDTLATESRSNDLDIQQRAGEFIQLLTQTTEGEGVLAAAPPVKDDDDETPPAPAVKAAPVDIDTWMDSPAQANAAAPKDDLLDDLLGGPVSPAQPAPQVSPPPVAKPVAPPVAQPVAPPVAKPVAPPVETPVVRPVAPPINPPGVQIFNSGDLQIYFEVQKKGDNPNMIAIRASAYNRSAISISGLLIEYAVNEGWIGQKDPPTGDTLAPNQVTPIQQVSYWKNNGVKTPVGVQLSPLQMSLRVTYKYGSMPFQEVRPVNPSVFN
jgi:hypothetical protein